MEKSLKKKKIWLLTWRSFIIYYAHLLRPNEHFLSLENTAKKFHILVLWIVHLTEKNVNVLFLNLQSFHKSVLLRKSTHTYWILGKTEGADFILFVRCSIVLLHIWLSNLGQFCFGCNQENIKLLSSRWAGKTGYGRPPREINVLFCHVWYAVSFWFLLLGFSFWLFI